MLTKRALLATAAFAVAAPAMAGNPGHAGPSYTPNLLPPASGPGECYARVKVPAQYTTATETIVTREAHTKLHVQQPKLASRTEQVMVKEPSVRFAVRQPSYRTVTEKVLTRPSYDKLSVSPPSFQTVTETLQTSAPRLVWKKGNPGVLARQGYTIHSTADGGAYGQGYNSTAHFGATGGERCGEMCEIWCLVEEPGESVSVTRQVMSSPGEVRRTRVPAVYQNIAKQVVSDPGGVEEIPVPAEYRSITVEDIVHPGGEALIEVPAEYGQVQKKHLVSDERYEWRRVLCQPGTGTIGHSVPQTSYVEPSYVAPSYSAPQTSYVQPSYAQPVAPADTYYLDEYERAQVCRDDGCASSQGHGASGAAHASGYYPTDTVYTTTTVTNSDGYAYEGGRHHRSRRRH